MSKTAPEPWPSCQKMTMKPQTAPIEMMLKQRSALRGSSRERNTAREQDVGDHGDDEDHPDEVAVDGLVEVGAAGDGPADAARRRAAASPRRAPRPRCRSSFSFTGNALTTAVSPRRHWSFDGATAPRTPSTLATMAAVLSGVALHHGDVVRGEHAGADAGRGQLVEALAGLPGGRQGVGARRAGREVEDRDEERDQDRQGDAADEPAVPDDQPAPGDPALAVAGGAPADAHAVEPAGRSWRGSPAGW